VLHPVVQNGKVLELGGSMKGRSGWRGHTMLDAEHAEHATGDTGRVAPAPPARHRSIATGIVQTRAWRPSLAVGADEEPRAIECEGIGIPC
jgi:hypothetical protein